MTVTGAGSTWSNSSGVNIGNSGTGTLTVADGGTVTSGGPLTVAVSAGSTGTLNIGAGAGGPAVAPGTLNAASVAFGAGTGTLNFNHTSTNYVFAPDDQRQWLRQRARRRHHPHGQQHLHWHNERQWRRLDRGRLDRVIEPDDGEQRRRTPWQRHRGHDRHQQLAASSFRVRWERPAR